MAETGEATATARSSSPLHVVVFPWLAFGHIIPYMELSAQPGRRGHAVTFVSTPRNLARLRPVPEGLRPRKLTEANLDLMAAGLFIEKD
uniref:Uncharacterized protein n=1 Tax=Aegilops tauschii TaxID=37682 RepID=M8BJG9_AEGTA